MVLLQKVINTRYLTVSFLLKAVCIPLLLFLLYSYAFDFFVHNDLLLPVDDTLGAHPDEYFWYLSTYRYYLFFQEKAYTHFTWLSGRSAFDNTNVVSFIFGLFLSIHGIDVNNSFDVWEKWWPDPAQVSPNTMIFYYENTFTFPKPALFVGRFYVALLSYLALVLCCLYFIRITNIVFSIIMCTYIHLFSFFYKTYFMSDLFVVFFYLLSILFYDYLYKARTPNKRLVLTIVYSLIVGVTMGVKLTCFLAALFFPLYIFLKIFLGIDKEHRRFDLLLLLLHISIVSCVFLMMHPQTYGNPFIGVYHFIEGGTQLVPPFNNIFINAISIFFYQITFLTATLRNLTPFNFHLCHFIDVIIFILAILGLLKMCTINAHKKQETFLRFIPLLLMVVAMPIGFSSLVIETDARYTWILPIVMSFIIGYGTYCASLQLVAFCKTCAVNILRNTK